MLTYVAIVEYAELVRDEWPDAAPVKTEVLEVVGKPLPHGPTEVPTPRYIDVLAHGLRHLRFLLDTDSESRSAIDNTWRSHLTTFEPALSGMYEHS